MTWYYTCVRHIVDNCQLFRSILLTPKSGLCRIGLQLFDREVETRRVTNKSYFKIQPFNKKMKISNCKRTAKISIATTMIIVQGLCSILSALVISPDVSGAYSLLNICHFKHMTHVTNNHHRKMLVAPLKVVFHEDNYDDSTPVVSTTDITATDTNNGITSSHHDKKDPVVIQYMKSLLPEQVASVFILASQWLMVYVPVLRTITVSFFVGAFVTLYAAANFPETAENVFFATTTDHGIIQNNNNQYKESMIIFKTILQDLDEVYVDEVNVQKLFETSISAMLRTLDPYTTFQDDKTAAKTSRTAALAGKFGGVGLRLSKPEPSPPPRQKQFVDDDELFDIEDQGVLYAPSFINNNNNNMKDAKSNSIQQNPKEKESSTTSSDIRVVSALEGYAFDDGIRVGDVILSVDDLIVNRETPLDDIRDRFRGLPGTTVTVTLERDGIQQTVTILRRWVKISNVGIATMLNQNVGYIQLRAFSSEDVAEEMRSSITSLLKISAADTSSSYENSSPSSLPLKGLILDLRFNPGGILTQGVDVASLFVPKGSLIASMKGRTSSSPDNIVYRSSVEPLVDTSVTNVVVLINEYTGSAAEAVAGALQDLDAGVIMGEDRTYGKGLVQKDEALPYLARLKYTVAKSYTPSGRCIQSTKYVKNPNDVTAKFTTQSVKEEERSIFFTKAGRIVKDGGGIEADVKVKNQKKSALEVALLRLNLFNEYADEWGSKILSSSSSSSTSSTNHDDFEMTQEIYDDFQKFVSMKQEQKQVNLLSQFYNVDAATTNSNPPLESLKVALKKSGFSLNKEMTTLEESILQEMKIDFIKFKLDITTNLEQAILSRYLPQTKLLERAVKVDVQVNAALNLIVDQSKFNDVLARTSIRE